MIVIDGLDTTASTANTDSYATNTLEPLPNGLLIAFVLATGTALVGSMSGGGLTWVSQGSHLGAASTIINCFTAQCGPSPGSFVATWVCTGDAATGCIIEVVHVAGHKVAAPIRQIKRASGTADPSFTMDVPFLAKSSYLSYLEAQDVPPFPAVPSGWSQIASGSYITPPLEAQVAALINGLTDSVVAWTAEEGWIANWNGFTLELVPASSIHMLASTGVGR